MNVFVKWITSICCLEPVIKLGGISYIPAMLDLPHWDRLTYSSYFGFFDFWLLIPSVTLLVAFTSYISHNSNSIILKGISLMGASMYYLFTFDKIQQYQELEHLHFFTLILMALLGSVILVNFVGLILMMVAEFSMEELEEPYMGIIDFTSQPGLKLKTSNSVLVIDDDMDYLMALKRKLEEVGLEVICSSSPTEGIFAARRSMPSLILMDMNLPEFSGEVATSRLKKDSMTSHIPVMAMSSNINHTDLNRDFFIGGYEKRSGLNELIFQIMHNLMPEKRLA